MVLALHRFFCEPSLRGANLRMGRDIATRSPFWNLIQPPFFLRNGSNQGAKPYPHFVPLSLGAFSTLLLNVFEYRGFNPQG